ncbi:MAG TPA: LamG-like jellyroll fold domain-containing protein [Verrucomicrobiae bacterium]|jgi:hypothetical protein
METKKTFSRSGRCFALALGAAAVLAAFNVRAGHALLAHFPFDTTDGNLDVQGIDTSGNGNDFTFGAGSGAGGGIFVTNDAAAGPLAIYFSTNGFGFGVLSWSATPSNILGAIQASFSVSCWIKTTQSLGDDGGPALDGAFIVAADANGLANDVIPMALTGSKIAFNTGGANNDTLHSMKSVNDGAYHFVVVTRDQVTGMKTIYIDGAIDARTEAARLVLSDSHQVTVGAGDDASYPNPITLDSFYNGYDGDLDDLQFYSGVLNADEVKALYLNPGSTAPNIAGGPNGDLVAHYTFDDPNHVGADASGNAFDLDYIGGPNTGYSLDNEVGGGSLFLSGAGYISYTHTPATVLAALASDFTLSMWVHSPATSGSDGESAAFGQGICCAATPGEPDDIIPMALCGGGIGFGTGNAGFSEDTLNSTVDINDNNDTYRFVVVTRRQSTGEKQIYIDGVLNTNGFASMDLLNSPQLIAFGTQTLAAQSNPTNASDGYEFFGHLDDIQLYSRVLGSADISFLFQNPGDVSTAPIAEGASPNLVAHYSFDDPNNLGADTSGHGFDLDFNGGDLVTCDNSTFEAGAGSAYFDGNSWMSYNTAPPVVLNTFGGNFTLSLWVNTSQSFGQDYYGAYDGAGIVTADIPGLAQDSVPMAQTGDLLGFNTGGQDFGDDTLTSTNLIDDGSFHHVVVTRDQATGVKQIYFDGALDSEDVASFEFLGDPKLIGVGAQIDGSQSDPNSVNPFDYFTGNLDDIQLYDRVLAPDEIAYLFNNPGSVVSTIIQAPVVNTGFQLSIWVVGDPVTPGNNFYYAFPYFQEFESPAVITEHRIYSPHNIFSNESTPTNNSANADYESFADMTEEITNGYWTLVINQGDPSEQVLHFQVSLAGLTSNLLQAPVILYPAYGQSNVPVDADFLWTAPTNYQTDAATVQWADGEHSYSTNFSDLVTNWSGHPPLTPGANALFLTFYSTNYASFAASVPSDAFGTPMVTNWSAGTLLNSTIAEQFIVVGGTTQPTPVAITDIAKGGGHTLSFSIQTLAGATNTIQTRTNLAVGPWIDLTNRLGDGTLQTFTISTTNAAAQFFRIKTQ